jgi:hypothetical protein
MVKKVKILKKKAKIVNLGRDGNLVNKLGKTVAKETYQAVMKGKNPQGIVRKAIIKLSSSDPKLKKYLLRKLRKDDSSFPAKHVAVKTKTVNSFKLSTKKEEKKEIKQVKSMPAVKIDKTPL